MIFRSKPGYMKTIFTAAAICLFIALSGYAQETCPRHTETAGRFSYCPPAGWVSKDPTSGTYKTFVTPDNATVRANLNMKDEVTSSTHNEYMAAALKILLADNPTKGADTRKVIGWTDFTTASNLRGSRMVYETEYKGLFLRTVQYIFDVPGKKLILTGTALESSKATTDPIFDGVAKTLRTF